MRNRESFARVIVVFGVLMAAATGCKVPTVPVDPTGGGGGGGAVNPTPTAVPTVIPTPAPTPSATPTPMPTTTPPASTAQSCVSGDPSHICIGLKLVGLVDNTTGIPSINNADAVTLVDGINKIWSQCNIGFQLENYQAADPTKYGLDYGSASESELTSLRNQFSDNATFLVVITGPWTGKTIAWTTMPGGGPFGTIVDDQYGHNPMTVGHELGHYQGLYHISDSSNLMNPYIGSNTSALNSSQCATAQQTDSAEWQPMLRR